MLFNLFKSNTENVFMSIKKHLTLIGFAGGVGREITFVIKKIFNIKIIFIFTII